MIFITDPGDLARITHPGIRQLVTLRFQQLNLPDVPDELDACPATLIVVGGGASVSELEQAAGIPITHALLDDLPFDHPDFVPPFEIMEEHQDEHSRFYELVFIGNDDGAATALFVPDEEGIDADLLAMCRAWATPAVNTP